MRRTLTLLLVLLTLGWSLAWGQGQLIPGNRTISGTFNAGTATGSSNAYLLTLNPALPAYLPNVQLTFRANHTNTGAATLNVNGLGAKAIKKWVSGALVDVAAGDITTNQEVLVYYDGTAMQIVGGGGSSAVALGPAGTLQASNGAGGLAAFSGSACNDPATVQVGTTSTGAAICQAPPSTSVAAHVLTDRSESGFPNAVNLATRSTGLLLSTVTSGVAALTTVPLPAGNLVGTLGPQELDNTRLNPRPVSLPDAATLTVDLSAADVVYVSALSQPTTFLNPVGVAKPGQLLRMQMSTTIPRALSWGTLWRPDVGFPLPTQTTGGGRFDDFWWQYNPITGGLDLLYNSQLSALTLPTGVTPGDYACPTNIHIDPTGRIGGITAGSCSGGGGGGGATAAGLTGDVQVRSASGLTADSGKFTHDVLSHWTSVQQLLAGAGTGAVALTDPHGYTQTIRAPSLTASRVAYLPDRNGVVPLTGGGVSGHLVLWDTDGVGLVDGGAPGGGSTTVTAAAVFTSGNLVQAAGNDRTTVDSGIAANQVATLSGTQTLSGKRNVPRVQTLSSASLNPSFQCDFASNDQCEVNATGSAGSLTVQLPTGTMQNGELRMFLFRCTNLQTFTWPGSFLASPNVPIPTQCPSGTATYFSVGVRYSSTLSAFQIIASN